MSEANYYKNYSHFLLFFLFLYIYYYVAKDIVAKDVGIYFLISNMMVELKDKDCSHQRIENQLCFPFYAISRLLTRQYQPFLSELGITYPQYLVLMLLWERDELNVNAIAKKLILNTNTMTPLLKRMEGQKLIKRKRCVKDERMVYVKLTKKGKDLQEKAYEIPHLIHKSMDYCEEDILDLKKKLYEFMNSLHKS